MGWKKESDTGLRVQRSVLNCKLSLNQLKTKCALAKGVETPPPLLQSGEYLEVQFGLFHRATKLNLVPTTCACWRIAQWTLA